MDDDYLARRESAISYRGTDYSFHIKACWNIEKAATGNGEKARLSQRDDIAIGLWEFNLGPSTWLSVTRVYFSLVLVKTEIMLSKNVIAEAYFLMQHFPIGIRTKHSTEFLFKYRITFHGK